MLLAYRNKFVYLTLIFALQLSQYATASVITGKTSCAAKFKYISALSCATATLHCTSYVKSNQTVKINM